MRIPLSACHINPNLFGVELHGKVYVRGCATTVEGRVGVLVDKASLLAMREAIQAALDGYAPTPAKVDFNPEDLA